MSGLSTSNADGYRNMKPASELHVGDVVEGVVTALTSDSIFIDIFCKTDACMSRSELKKDENIKINDSIRVKIISINRDKEIVSVSRNRVIEEENIEKLKLSYEKKEAVTGMISAVESHGFTVMLCTDIKAFMPFSHVGLSKIRNPAEYLNKTLPVLITKLERLRNSYDVVVSHREILTIERQEARSIFLQKYKEGDVVTGTVESVFANYARIKVDGVLATIVQTEISWLNNVSLQRELKVGATITAKILSISEEGQKVFLSIKATVEDPWLTIEEKLTIDSIVEGEVETIKDFGVFVRILDKYQGLVHISEVSWENEKKAITQYEEGQRIKVRIMDLDVAQRRLTLSIRKISTSPWEQYYQTHADQMVTVTIVQAHKFGLVCKINDSNVEGFLHHTHISWGNRQYDPAEFNVGGQMQVAVIGISDRHRKVRLSLKMCQDNPWEMLLQLKKEHAVIEVTISHKTKDGLIVSVGDDVEGFIHVNHLANFERLSQADLLESLQQGETIEANITMVDKQKRKIYLSTRDVEAAYENEQMEKYMMSDDDPTANIADLTDRL